jgi:hypothetical protein
VQKIIGKGSSCEDYIKYYVCLEDMFNVVQKIHITTVRNHGIYSPVFVISLRSSAVLIFEIISSGKEDEARPTFASTPNIAFYGVRLIPEWLFNVVQKIHITTDMEAEIK